jgi:hypothetical protein
MMQIPDRYLACKNNAMKKCVPGVASQKILTWALELSLKKEKSIKCYGKQ